MARKIQRQSQDNTQLVSIDITSFNKGAVNLLESSRIPPEAAEEATNLMQDQDGIWTTRWGTQYYGQVAPNGQTIDGAFEWVDPNDGSTKLGINAGGTIYTSTDGGTQTAVTGATLTAGVKMRTKQLRGFAYLINSTDVITRYNGSVLTQYTSLSTPGAPTPTRGSSLSAGGFTYYYQIVATNAVGFTAGGAEGSITVNVDRDSWTGVTGNQYIDLSWSRVTNALRYDIYIATASGFEVYLDSVPDPGSGSVTYRDDGTVAANDLAEVPVDNTTTGPKVGTMEISGNRLWGTLDAGNRQRVYWSGAGQYQGYFSPFYGGGYTDIEKGGRERPYAVVDGLDGKGTPTLLVLTSDPEGVGSVHQITLETATVGDTTFLVPNLNRLQKSVGTASPDSVVKVRGKDTFFANQRGAYSLGTQPSVLNVLITDELSVNIRPYWRSLVKAGITNICAYQYDGKVFFAVPKSGSTNSHVVIYDLERKNWAFDWNVAVKQFLEYTDSAMDTHLLGVPVSGTQLIEFASGATNDAGGASFSTSYSSGLLPVAKNRFAWAQITRALFEFSGLNGTVTISILGTEKNRQFSTVASRTFSGTTSNAGLGSLQLGQSLLGYSAANMPTYAGVSMAYPYPVTFTQASSKKYLKVNRLLNNLKFRVSSSSNNAEYTLLALRAEGFEAPISPPANWRS